MPLSATGIALKPPPGTSASLASELTWLAALVFDHGYVDALRRTMLLPIAIVALAAVSAFAIRQAPGAQAADRRRPGPGGSATRGV